MKIRLFENSGKEAGEGIAPVMRRVFTGADGRALLRYMLFDWSYFSICNTPEQQIMRNYATKFLGELGNLYGVEITAEIIPAADTAGKEL
jgi:hypothetical protein